MTPTPEQINEYALKRWAEAKGWKIVTTCDQTRRVGLGNRENEPHYHKRHTCEYLSPEKPIPKTINRAFFAELPIDDEEAFYAHLFEIAGVAHSNKRFEWFNAILKARIDDLLLAYWQMGNK